MLYGNDQLSQTLETCTSTTRLTPVCRIRAFPIDSSIEYTSFNSWLVLSKSTSNSSSQSFTDMDNNDFREKPANFIRSVE